MSAPHMLRLALAVALAVTGPALAKGGVEPNTLVAEGQVRYVAAAFPDRIVASPAQAAAHDVLRTNPSVRLPDLAPPRLEAAGDEAWLVHLDHGGGTSLRHVVRTMSAPHQLTCGGAAKVQALFDVTTPG